MIKTAVLISGLVRDYDKKHISLFKNVLDCNDLSYDIFLHTWDIVGGAKKAVTYSKNLAEDDWVLRNPDQIDIDDVKSAYSTNYIECENYNEWKGKMTDKVIDFDKKFNTNEYTRILNSIFAQHYKINMCYKFFERSVNTKDYDIVIRARFDSDFSKKIVIDEGTVDECKDSIICPGLGGSLSELKGKNIDVMEDQFGVGSPHTMRCYCSLHEDMLRLREELPNDFVIFPEALLAYNLINHYKIKVNVKYDTFRN
jgi:hypothetical protein